MKRPRIIVIVGPTASGKSDLAIKLAKKFNGEIISADSRQIYKEMDIGTGKITKKEQKLAKHYLLDVVSPKKQFTVSDFKKLGEKAIKEILSKNKIPIIVGGTGFYIDALVKDLKLPEVPPNKKLRQKLGKKSVEELIKQLKKLDPRRAKNIDFKNKRWLIRAIEIIIATKKTVPQIKGNDKYDVLWFGVKWPKEILEKRIKIRLDKRLKQGMVTEVKKLIKSGINHKRLYDFGLEYRWISQYLQNKISYQEMKNSLLKAVIQYSKRQMTWFTQPHFWDKSGAGFKRNKEIKWIKNQTEVNKLTKKFLISPF